MKTIQCCIILFLFICSDLVYGQLSNFSSLAPTDCWNITYQSSRAMRIYLRGEIFNNQNQLICSLKSESLQLRMGSNTWNKDWVRTSKIDYNNDEVQRIVATTGNLPEGSYTLCTHILDASGKTEITKICRSESMGKLLKMKDQKSKFKNISAYGAASVEYSFVSPHSVYNFQPSSFVRIEAEQGLSIYSFPIAGAFRYTTEKTSINQDVNMFSLKFDRSRFERDLKSMILRKLAEAQLKKVMENAGDLQKLSDIENLEKTFKDEALTQVKREVMELENKLKSLAGEKTSDAKKEYDIIKNNYEQLMRRKRELEAMKLKYEQLQSLKKNWIDNGRLNELQDLAYNPPDLTDPKEMKSLIIRYGAYTGMNKFLFNIRELSLGTSFPVYSPLTLNGTQIFGGSIDWNPGLFYIAVSGGKIHSPIHFAIDSSAAQYTQKMLGMRFGLGKIEGTHISINALRFFDVDSSITTDQFQEFYPQSSWVGSVDFNVGFAKNRVLEFGGEVAGLMQNHNTYDTLQTYYLNNFQSQIADQLEPNLSSSADFAYTGFVKLNLFKGRSQFIVENQYTGPGYKHPGVFGLPNDLIRYSARWDQSMGKSRNKISAFYNQDYDNISDSKSYQTDRNELGIETQIATKILPHMHLRISLNRLKSNYYFFNSGIVNVGLNKSFKWAKYSISSTQLQCMYLRTTTDSVAQNINTIYAFIQQNLSFKYGISINLSAQYSNNAVANLTSRNTGYQLLLGKIIAKKVKLLTGIGYNSQNTNNKLAYTISVEGVIFKNFQINLRAFKNKYSEYPGVLGKYNETYVQAGIRYSW